MADPVTAAMIAATIPVILGGIQSGLQLVLDAMPEIHDARNKHAVKKLNALFFKATRGELTEKDYQQAKRYYFKIQAVALLSENQILLDHIEKGLHLMEGTLVVKNLMEKNDPIDSSDIEIFNSKIQGLNIGDALMQTSEKHAPPDYESTMSSPAPLEGQTSRTTEKKLAIRKAEERFAMWCLVAVMPPLLFVPKIRHKC